MVLIYKKQIIDIMINLFKKKAETNYIAEYAEKLGLYDNPEPVITSKDIQKDLHISFEQVLAEFDLKESKETQIENYKASLKSFKEENKTIYNKIETLNNLGFVSTPSAQKSLKELQEKELEVNNKIKSIEAEISKTERIKELTAQYTLMYPFYKFIDEDTMIKIMHKYNLVLGEVFMYSREIPEENLEVISYFSTAIKDTEKTLQLIETTYAGIGGHSNYQFRDKPKPVKVKNMEGVEAMWISSLAYESVRQEFKVSDLKMIAPQTHFTIPTFETRDYRFETVNIPVAKLNTETRKFEFSTKKLEENQAKIREVLDPIACLEVEGGYIVLTAWDEEAMIPEIQTNMLS